ncbi:MAG: hypothetical protein LBK23_04650 [Oscillospiraceae bacterium]|jgi:hypothetical protein|nr:hypothetical protein [Oscillospiraceae bacterium]
MLNLITETMLYFGRGAEPSLEPPETDEILADCGHEIYPNEPVYISPSAGTLCEQCVRDRAQDLDAAALAAALGYERSYVL